MRFSGDIGRLNKVGRHPTALLEHTERMLGSSAFLSELAQIRAKAALQVIGQPIDAPRWTYVAPRMSRHTAAALYAIEDAALSDPAVPDRYKVWSRQIALAWESLARLNEGPPRSTALLNAAIAYELAGYQANASFIAKELAQSSPPDSGIDGEQLVATFLQRKLIATIELAAAFFANPPDAESPWGDIAMQLGEGLLADGLVSACKYFLGGDHTQLDRSTERLLEASKLFDKLQAPLAASMAYGIRSVLPQMERRSTWNHLHNRARESNVWKRYLTLLARGGSEPRARGVTELWPSQVAALNSPAIDSSTSAIVRLPTSGGKTRVAEMAIVETLVNDPDAKCVFVAPYRALAFEIEKSLGSVLVDLGFRVSSAVGTYESDEFESHLLGVADLMITTPEKMDLILRSRPEVATAIKLVVLDEVHIIDDANRGIKFELLLSRIKSRFPDCKFLVMSAVIPDESLQAFSRWLAGSSDSSISSDWRPTIQRVAKFEWLGNMGVIRFKQDQDAPGLHTFVPKVLESRRFRYIHPVTLRWRKPIYPKSEKREIAAELAYTFSEQGPTLVFCTQPQFVESVCKTIINRSIGLREATGEVVHAHFTRSVETKSLMLSRSWLGDDHIATRALSHGVAPHHGRLPHALREAIESDCRAGKYKVVVATNTLAQGVNLPVRTVIIHSTWRGDSSGKRSRIPVRDYWNIAGRAGRAGQETEGLVLHITLNDSDNRDYAYYSDSSNLEVVEGALFARLQTLVRDRFSSESIEEISAVLDPEVLAIAVEEGITDADAEAWGIFTGNSLAAELAKSGIETPDPLLTCIQYTAKHAFERIPDPHWRQVFAITGLSSWSCNSIHDSVTAREREIWELLVNADSGDLPTLNQLVTDICVPLEETQTTTQYSGDLETLIHSWINGDSIREIWDQTVKGEDSLEMLTRFVDEFLSYRLPWAVSGFLTIAREICSVNEQDLSELVRSYSSMIKFGVPDPIAAWAMASGVPTRESAIRMARVFALSESRDDSYEGFISWIGNLSDDSLRIDFDISGYALADLKHKLRKLIINPYLKPIRSLDEFLPLEAEIVGTEIGNRWVATRNLNVGDELELRRDFEDSIDANAISIFHKNLLLGHLDFALAQRLAPELDAGIDIRARVAQFSIASAEPVPNISATIMLPELASS